ncbi:hypothetical protein N9B00_00750 [bacterium]|nr:hypothetical protein [bacterium]
MDWHEKIGVPPRVSHGPDRFVKKRLGDSLERAKTSDPASVDLGDRLSCCNTHPCPVVGSGADTDNDSGKFFTGGDFAEQI